MSRKPVETYLKTSNISYKKSYIHDHPCLFRSKGDDPEYSVNSEKKEINQPQIDNLIGKEELALLSASLNKILDEHHSELSSDLQGSFLKIEKINLAVSKAGSVIAWAILRLPEFSLDQKLSYAQKLVEPLYGDLKIKYGITKDEKNIVFLIPKFEDLTSDVIEKAQYNFINRRYFYMSWLNEVTVISIAGKSEVKAPLQNIKLRSEYTKNNYRFTTNFEKLAIGDRYAWNLPPQKQYQDHQHQMDLINDASMKSYFLTNRYLMDNDFQFSKFNELKPTNLIAQDILRRIESISESGGQTAVNNAWCFKISVKDYQSILTDATFFVNLITKATLDSLPFHLTKNENQPITGVVTLNKSYQDFQSELFDIKDNQLNIKIEKCRKKCPKKSEDEEFEIAADIVTALLGNCQTITNRPGVKSTTGV